MAHRVGRNDPCPCGSGKKYKKCCLPAGRTVFPQAAAPHYADDETSLPLCSDRYLPCAEPRDDAAIGAALDSIPGADRMVEDDPGTTGWHFEEVEASGVGGRMCHFATAALNAEALVVLGASVEDLDVMRQRIEGAAGGLLRYESRKVTTREDLDRLMEEDPPTEEDMEEILWSPGEATLFREHKAAYYARWPREPQPYLDGRTPLAAMSIPRFRRHIEGILDDMEEREALVHSEIRIDLTGLRRELGLEDLPS